MNYFNSFLNTRLVLYISFFVFCVVSFMFCEPDVVFDKAMPPDTEEIQTIPNVFQGLFLCESDSSFLRVEERMVFQESYVRFITTLDKIRKTENCSVVNEGILLPEMDRCLPFEYINDTLIAAKIHKTDTLFRFAKTEVAKLYKGRLFMNIMDERNNWITFMITPQHDGALLWEMIDVPDQIKKIEAITFDYESVLKNKDETQYVLNPTLVEFEEILKKNYTLECDILTPIRIEVDPLKIY